MTRAAARITPGQRTATKAGSPNTPGVTASTPSPAVADGTAIYDLADLDPLFADVQVPERQVAQLAAGQTVRVTTFDPLLPESRQRNFQGRLLAVDVDPGAPEDTRRGLVTVLDEATPTEWQISLAGIRKANLIADPFPRENKR